MILVDTGFWFALINKHDKHHQMSIDFLSDCRENLITTWPAITETTYLLGKSLGVKSQVQFIQLVKSELVQVFSISIAHLNEVEKLMVKYADLPMDLADASLLILASEQGYGRILSTDQRDFHCYRWKNRQPFQNLLFPEQ